MNKKQLIEKLLEDINKIIDETNWFEACNQCIKTGNFEQRFKELLKQKLLRDNKNGNV